MLKYSQSSFTKSGDYYTKHEVCDLATVVDH